MQDLSVFFSHSLNTSRFALKLQKLDEKEAHFITRLHAGRLQIIPWPVIESEEFYELFADVARTLDEQETSHHTTGEFLLTLKTLMAKLKVRMISFYEWPH